MLLLSSQASAGTKGKSARVAPAQFGSVIEPNDSPGPAELLASARSEASADAQTIGVELVLFIASSARRRTELTPESSHDPPRTTRPLQLASASHGAPSFGARSS